MEGAGQGERGGIYPGIDSSDPQLMTAAGRVLFFAATDHLRGRELWALSHTGAAPYDRYSLGNIDVLPGLGSSEPLDLCSSGGAGAALAIAARSAGASVDRPNLLSVLASGSTWPSILRRFGGSM